MDYYRKEYTRMAFISLSLFCIFCMFVVMPRVIGAYLENYLEIYKGGFFMSEKTLDEILELLEKGEGDIL